MIENYLKDARIFASQNVLFENDVCFKTSVSMNKPVITVIDMKSKKHVVYKYDRMFLRNKEQSDFVDMIISNYRKDLESSGIHNATLFNSVKQRCNLVS